MPNIIDGLGIPRKVLPIIYVVDIFDHMVAERMSKLNRTMREALSVFKNVYDKCDYYDIQINVLLNSVEDMWMYNDLQAADKFEWKEMCITQVKNPIVIIEELAKNLSRHKMLESNVGFAIPYIVLISD